jgi:DHA1 family tetracycline resistance protein-like MFS transporter
MSAAPTTSRGALAVVFATVFLDLVGFGLIIPVQAYYAESFGARPAVVTLLGASYSLMQFLFMPFWGRLSDRIGRRPVILSSVAISCLGFLLFGLAGSLPMLFGARMLAGFGNANIGVAQAVIADTTRPEDRAKGMGLIGLAFGLGFVIGPAIGGTLGQYSLQAPPLAAAVLAACNWLSAWFLLPETLQKNGQPKPDRKLQRKEILAKPQVIRLMVLSLVITTGFALMEQVLALFVEHHWVPEAHVAATADAGRKRAALLTTYVLLTVGVTMSVVQGGLIGKMAKRFGESRLIQVGCGITIVGLVLQPLIGEAQLFGLLLVNAVVLAFGQGMTTPSITGLLSRTVGPFQQGTALGLGQSMAALGRVLGPGISGTLFELGNRWPFWTGAGLVFVGLLVALRLHTPPQQTAAVPLEPE